uniref:Protein kinase domain-containing protein n=1 Tax=Chromera velia CCMP2878 TaxID=1169474 RepID=A0A0G4G0H5_9ALVE|eukprot:Cvel_4003.t1-p1 / transcript=Cvel_4003.t1 / gene=Cvel_4003 / organism=Chromera_velia_CCMP2878 / gene_product=SNF1-related protein kinase catalytic subunit alpha, putative / transcript_product=SNF1-related protein kinase catalytic subunit alpha, putative / location=Cvel_scaffold170:42372-47001(+) / protein_length=601 / sequence_SO=supercontig / SO=protein_coding / is_pseudo=false
MEEDQGQDGVLPWFLAHPWQLGDYTVARPWTPYDPNTGEGRYEFVRSLQEARANQGFVALYRDRNHPTEEFPEGRPCAVKVVPLTYVREALRVNGTEQPLNDSGALRYLSFFVDCRHVARWYDCGRDNTYMYFVSEFASEGDLFPFLEFGSRRSEIDIRCYMYQVLHVLTGVDCLHRSGVAHMDLSVENVIRKADDTCVLIDFGMAFRLVPDPMNPGHYLKCPTRRGKAKYQDPVMWTGQPFDAIPADIFSCGAMLLILLVTPWIKTYPWDTTNHTMCIRFKYFMQKGLQKLLEKYRMHDRLSAQVVDLMEKMLRINPAERPSAAELKLHPWFTAAPDPRLQALIDADAQALAGSLPVPGSAPASAADTFGPVAEEALTAAHAAGMFGPFGGGADVVPQISPVEPTPLPVPHFHVQPHGLIGGGVGGQPDAAAAVSSAGVFIPPGSGMPTVIHHTPSSPAAAAAAAADGSSVVIQTPNPHMMEGMGGMSMGTPPPPSQGLTPNPQSVSTLPSTPSASGIAPAAFNPGALASREKTDEGMGVYKAAGGGAGAGGAANGTAMTDCDDESMDPASRGVSQTAWAGHAGARASDESMGRGSFEQG